MDEKQATGNRLPFRFAVVITPMLIVGRGPRHAVVIVNEGPNDVWLGETGTALEQWMYLPAGQCFPDNYSEDDWWAYAPSGSGTVSGFVVSA